VAAAERPDLDPLLLPSSGAVLIHGELDTVVPIGLSRSYAKAHPSSRLVELSGTAHFELIDPRGNAWPVVIQELQRLLAGARGIPRSPGSADLRGHPARDDRDHLRLGLRLPWRAWHQEIPARPAVSLRAGVVPRQAGEGRPGRPCGARLRA